MEFRRALPTALVTSLLMLAAPSASGGLLESMPSGSGFFLTFDPEAIGMDRFLGVLDAGPPGTDGDIDQLRELLGFDPLAWDCWEEALVLQADREIGLLVRMGEYDPSLLALYLPSADPSAVEDLFRGITASLPGFDGSLKFRRSGEYTIVLLGEDASAITAFDPAASPLGSDPRFLELAGDGMPGLPLGAIYLDLRGMASEDLHGLHLRSSVDEGTIALRLSLLSTDADLARIAGLLAPSSEGAAFSVPAGTDGTLRVRIDMESLDSLLAEQGIRAEYDTGAAEFGLMTSGELLDFFTGELLFSVSSTPPDYSVLLQIGLQDPEAAGELLHLVRTIQGSSDGVITDIDRDGVPCHRVAIPVAPGIGALELGVYDDVLVVAGGCSLRDPEDGMDYGEFLEARAPAMDPDRSAVFTATQVLLYDLIGNDDSFARHLAELAGGLALAAASLETDGPILRLTVTLESADGDADALLTRILETSLVDLVSEVTNVL